MRIQCFSVSLLNSRSQGPAIDKQFFFFFFSDLRTWVQRKRKRVKRFVGGYTERAERFQSLLRADLSQPLFKFTKVIEQQMLFATRSYYLEYSCTC